MYISSKDAWDKLSFMDGWSKVNIFNITAPIFCCCCCVDYSVLMYRDDIQLQDVKECCCYTDCSVLMYRDDIHL